MQSAVNQQLPDNRCPVLGAAIIRKWLRISNLRCAGSGFEGLRIMPMVSHLLDEDIFCV